MMGDDDGRIPFFVSDNDLNYEKGSRRSRKTTKEEAMLGIFGGDYSSDEEGTSGRRGSRCVFCHSSFCVCSWFNEHWPIMVGALCLTSPFMCFVSRGVSLYCR